MITFEQFMLCYVFWIPWGKVLSRSRAYLGSTERRIDTPAAEDAASALS